MVAQLIISVLIWLHVFSVTGWFGSNLLFDLAIFPIIPRLSSQTRNEFIRKFFPNISKFIGMFGALTLIFGIILALAISNGDFGIFAPSNWFGLRIDIGALLGLLSGIIGGAVARPAGNRLIEIAKSTETNPQTASPTEIPSLERRLRVVGLLSLVFLGIALAFMIAAATGV